jgi:hypothetical protein
MIEHRPPLGMNDGRSRIDARSKPWPKWQPTIATLTVVAACCRCCSFRV